MDEYKDRPGDEWASMLYTQRVKELYLIRLHQAIERLESAARASADPDLRGLASEIQALRGMVHCLETGEMM
jgi:predicted metal-dependent hydrolase